MTTINLGRVVGEDGEDGRGIVNIRKTGTSGLVDTYTITYTDNTTSTYTVTNGAGGTADVVKDRALVESIRQISKLTTFPLYNIPGNVGIIGDSTISGAGGEKIATFLEVDQGFTITDISHAGDSIYNQTTKWDNLSASVKSDMDYVFVEIGLNDVPFYDINTIKTKYATLINKIKHDTSNAQIIICTMTPNKGLLKSAYPDKWQSLVTVWEQLNDSIKNNEYGASKVCYLHTEALAYDSNCLRPEYDSGDHIHENTAGSKIIAYCWSCTAVDNSEKPGKEVVSIEATYTQGQTVVYPSTSLDSLKSNLVVVATYADSSTETLQSNEYTLSGTLSVGTSTITVTYLNQTDTFDVTVSEAPTAKWVYADANNMSHDTYKAEIPSSSKTIGSPYWIYITDTSFFEGKKVTKACVLGRKADTVTLYATPISDNPTTANEIEVGHFSVTANNTEAIDYDVENPQVIPQGYTLAVHYTVADSLKVHNPATLTKPVGVKIRVSAGTTSYTTEAVVGGPDFYVVEE